MTCETCVYGHIIRIDTDEDGGEALYVHCNFSDVDITGPFEKCFRYKFENKIFGGVQKCLDS